MKRDLRGLCITQCFTISYVTARNQSRAQRSNMYSTRCRSFHTSTSEASAENVQQKEQAWSGG